MFNRFRNDADDAGDNSDDNDNANNANNTGANDNNTGNNDRSRTNNDDNLNPFATPDDNNSDDNRNTRTVDNANSSNSGDRSGQIREYYNQQGLYANLDRRIFLEAVRDGDEEKAGVFLDQMLENAVNVSITAANRLIAAQVNKAKKDAVDEAHGRVHNDLAFDSLTRELPFLKDPAVEPVARTVLNGFIAQGLSMNEALKRSARYFEKTVGAGAQHYGYEQSRRNQRTNSRGFNDGRSRQFDNNDNDRRAFADPEDTDWTAILSGR